MLAWGNIKDRNATSVCVCVFIYVVERKQKGVMSFKMEDELLLGRDDFFIWHLREWQVI